MKKIFIIAAIAMASLSLKAQVVFNETFDTNAAGWQEYASKAKKCLIADGVMYMQTDDDAAMTSTCYAQFIPQQNFVMECQIQTKKREVEFGIVFDYMDDYNYRAVYVSNTLVYYVKLVEGKLVGYRLNEIKKLSKVKANGINLKLKQESQKLTVLVDDMQALELRYVDIQHAGVGLYAGGNQKLSFDSFTIKQ